MSYFIKFRQTLSPAGLKIAKFVSLSSRFKLVWRVAVEPRWLVDLFRFRRRVDVLFICSAANLNTKRFAIRYSRYFDPIVRRLGSSGAVVEFATWDRAENDSNEINYKWLGPICWTHWTSTFFLTYVCRPRVIVTIGGYRKFIEAAKLLDIKVLELTHGFGLSVDDYKLGVHQKIIPSPTSYVTFDEQTYQTLLLNKYKNYDVVRCRHPSFGAVQSHDELLESLPNRKIALVSLQHGYEGSRDFLNGIIPNGIIHHSLVNIIKKNKNLYWIIKLHPVQMMEGNESDILQKLRAIFKGDAHVEFERFNSTDIALILSKASIHVTMMSGAVAEAAAFRVPSLGLCPTLMPGGLMDKAFFSARNSGFFHVTKLREDKIQLKLDELILSHEESELGLCDFLRAERQYLCVSEYVMSFLNSGMEIKMSREN